MQASEQNTTNGHGEVFCIIMANLYQVTQWPSSSSAYTPHPWERLGRILLSCSPCPDFYMGKTSSYNPDENKPCPTEVLVWVSGRLAPLNTSWHISKPKSRHRQRSSTSSTTTHSEFALRWGLSLELQRRAILLPYHHCSKAVHSGRRTPWLLFRIRQKYKDRCSLIRKWMATKSLFSFLQKIKHLRCCNIWSLSF